MKNMTFPRWAAPLVGVGIGALVGLRAARREGQPMSWEWLFGGAALGLLGGGVVWLLDRPVAKPIHKAEEEAAGDTSPSKPKPEQGELIGRFLALLAILLCCVPAVGLGLGVLAVLMNLQTPGWPRTASWVGAGLSAVTTVIFVAFLVAGK